MDVTLLHICTMVATVAPMYPFLWGGVGEDTATATDITADIAMEGIRGIRGGIGKRAAVEPTHDVPSDVIPCSCRHAR